MSTPEFHPEQTDALRELANIGMGRAANALSQILQLEIELSIPKVELIEASAVVQLVNDEISQTAGVLTRQTFSHGLNGEAILMFADEFLRSAADGGQAAADLGDELLLEITNIMASAFLGSMAEPLDATLYFSPPSILRSPLAMENYERDWRFALMLDIAMGTDQGGQTKLLLVFPENAIESLRASINRVLEDL